MSTVSMHWLNDSSSRVSSIDSCHSKEYRDQPYLTNTVGVGSEPYGTGENTRAVKRLHGSSKFVGVASVSFDLLAPL